MVYQVESKARINPLLQKLPILVQHKSLKLVKNLMMAALCVNAKLLKIATLPIKRLRTQAAVFHLNVELKNVLVNATMTTACQFHDLHLMTCWGETGPGLC